MILLQLAILVYSIILHEIAHGWIADKLGDPTARLMGRLTLDPRPHIDPIMTIFFPLILTLTGSPVVFGSAKPVPIDSFNFREPKKDTALSAAAGPITNLLIALFFAILIRLSAIFIVNNMVLENLVSLFSYGVLINVFLAVFNLLPIPPLDGSKVLIGILPDEYAKIIQPLESMGIWLVFLLLFFFPNVIHALTIPISQTIISLLLK